MNNLNERVMTPIMTCIECSARRMRANRMTRNIRNTFTVLNALRLLPPF